MKKLFVQILKFGFAGGITTIFDFSIFALLNMFGVPYIISNICSYLCAILVSYWMSMNFVFARKEEWSRKKEFVVFVILSLLGLLLNLFLLWFFYEVFYKKSTFINLYITDNTGKMICKIGATIMLHIFNFCSRKIFLEKRFSTE